MNMASGIGMSDRMNIETMITVTETPGPAKIILAFAPTLNQSLYNSTPGGNASIYAENTTWSPEEMSGDLVPCGLFFFIVYGPLFCAVCLVGLVGNALSFLVLHKYSRDTVATFLLKALAVGDNLFLATASFVQIYPAMSMYFGLTAQLRPIYPYLQTYAWPVAHMVQMGSVYMMVLVAANRYIAVCRPLQAPRLCTKRQVYNQIIAMTAAIVIYNIPRFFEYRYVTKATENSTVIDEPENIGLVSYTIYNILYENISYLIFVFMLPLIVLTIFNVHLVYELRKASESRKTLSSGKSREENNITLVMIVIILIFIMCQTPASINQVLFYTIGQDGQERCTNYERYYHLSNLFITMNSSTNFFVYCLFRRQFQHELWALICCYEWRGKGPRPLRRTLILRALHQHNSLSQSFSRTFGGSLRSNTPTSDCATQMSLLHASHRRVASCKSGDSFFSRKHRAVNGVARSSGRFPVNTG